MKNTLNLVSPPSSKSNVVAFSNACAAAGDKAPASMPLQAHPFKETPRPPASRYANSDAYMRCPYGEAAAASIGVAGVWLILYLFAVVHSYNSDDHGATPKARSLEIDKVLLRADTSSLPIQEIEDQTFVFSSAVNHSRNNRPVSSAEAQ